MSKLKRLIKSRIQEKRNWIEQTEKHVDENNNLTKKERNYYLKEMLNQISIIKDYEELLNDFKNDQD